MEVQGATRHNLTQLGVSLIKPQTTTKPQGGYYVHSPKMSKKGQLDFWYKESEEQNAHIVFLWLCVVLLITQ